MWQSIVHRRSNRHTNFRTHHGDSNGSTVSSAFFIADCCTDVGTICGTNCIAFCGTNRSPNRVTHGESHRGTQRDADNPTNGCPQCLAVSIPHIHANILSDDHNTESITDVWVQWGAGHALYLSNRSGGLVTVWSDDSVWSR